MHRLFSGCSEWGSSPDSASLAGTTGSRCVSSVAAVPGLWSTGAIVVGLVVPWNVGSSRTRDRTCLLHGQADSKESTEPPEKPA